MTQEQEMEFADLHIDRPEASYQGYRGSSYRDSARSAYRQEQGSQFAPEWGINPTFMMQMRLGLIIVSLFLWVIVFFGSIVVLLKIPGNMAALIDPLLFCGLAVFTLLAVLGNFFFLRRR